ncbi:MAG: integrase [Candidatus Pelagisphaera sp.]|jgi:integrase
MARKSRFKITRFENPSGESAFRVSGSLNGKQIRRNFKERKYAVAERERLEVKRLNGPSDGRFIWAKMTPEQNDDAWAAIKLLKNAGIERTLTDSAQYYIQHFRAPEVDIALEEATKQYLILKENELCNNSISASQFKSLRSRIRRFDGAYAGRLLADIQTQDIEELLAQGNVSPKTWNNDRAYLNTFFEFCIEQRFVSKNPVARVKRFKIKKTRGTAATLSASKSEELLRFIEQYEGHNFQNGNTAGSKGCLVPFFALALFAGVRPDWRYGEISKILPNHINLDTNTIHIEPEVSKNDEKRTIRIQPNLKKWLKAYPLNRYPIIPIRDIQKSLREIRKRHELSHDVLRHTYISMHVGKFRSVGNAALEAGNSESIVRRHYLNVKSISESTKFWEIRPQNT